MSGAHLQPFWYRPEQTVQHPQHAQCSDDIVGHVTVVAWQQRQYSGGEPKLHGVGFSFVISTASYHAGFLHKKYAELHVLFHAESLASPSPQAPSRGLRQPA